MAPKKSNKNKKQGEQPARRSIDLEAANRDEANRDEAGTVVTGVEVLLSFFILVYLISSRL